MIVVIYGMPKVSTLNFSKALGGSFKKSDFPVGSAVAYVL